MDTRPLETSRSIRVALLGIGASFAGIGAAGGLGGAAGCGPDERARRLGESCTASKQCESSFCYQATCLDPALDDDLDGLINEVEKGLGTHPLLADTDEDGLRDDLEVGGDFAAPLDHDQDGRIDAVESNLVDGDQDCLVDQVDSQEDVQLKAVALLADQGCCCWGPCHLKDVTTEASCVLGPNGKVHLVCEPAYPDADGDGKPDACPDGGGLEEPGGVGVDPVERCPVGGGSGHGTCGGEACADQDGDGVCDEDEEPEPAGGDPGGGSCPGAPGCEPGPGTVDPGPGGAGEAAVTIAIPAGPFAAGCAAGDDECLSFEGEPAIADLAAFLIDRDEVSQARYLLFATATGRALPDCAAFTPEATPDHPVACVTWQDATAFCVWAGGRLPSAAEWLKAARGGCETTADCLGAARKYPWGDAAPGCSEAVMNDPESGDGCGAGGPQPAGAAGGESPYGVRDLAGNVWEWTSDPWPGRPESRVVLGGGWNSGAALLRSSFRAKVPAGASVPTTGFRCAADGEAP